jgi:hypothetical protein
MQNTPVEKRRVRAPKMADILDISLRTLKTWQDRRFIPYEKIGRVVLFDVEEVLKAVSGFKRVAEQSDFKPRTVRSKASISEEAKA